MRTARAMHAQRDQRGHLPLLRPFQGSIQKGMTTRTLGAIFRAILWEGRMERGAWTSPTFNPYWLGFCCGAKRLSLSILGHTLATRWHCLTQGPRATTMKKTSCGHLWGKVTRTPPRGLPMETCFRGACSSICFPV